MIENLIWFLFGLWFGDAVACVYDLNTCGCSMLIFFCEVNGLNRNLMKFAKKQIGYQFKCYIPKGNTMLHNTTVNIFVIPSREDTGPTVVLSCRISQSPVWKRNGGNFSVSDFRPDEFQRLTLPEGPNMTGWRFSIIWVDVFPTFHMGDFPIMSC